MLNVMIPVSLNDSLISGDLRIVRAHCRKKQRYMQTLSTLTFAGLIDVMAQRANTKNTSAQSLANQVSALRGFMSNFRLRDDSPVGSHLRTSYYKNLATHLENLSAQGRIGSYIANRKSILGRCHGLVLELDRVEAAKNSAPTPFQVALSDLFSRGFSQKKIAVDAGVSLASVKRWLNGITPSVKALPSLRRLETYFGLEPGALIDLTPVTSRGYQSSVGETPQIAYRQRLSVASRKPYALTHISPGLQQQWLEFLRYKTDKLTDLERQKSARWSLAKESPRRRSEKLWFCFLGQEYAATASINWLHVSYFLGWLAMPRETEGGGLSSANVQSLAWLMFPRFLKSYVAWRIKQSGGAYHAGIVSFLKFVRGLTHSRTGYLTQSPELISTLPDEYRPNDWLQFSKAAFEWVTTAMAQLSEEDLESDENGCSRSSMEPIQAVLELSRPMEAVADMVLRMKAERPATGGEQEAIWLRDVVLIKILASNPLRAKNLKLMTYLVDNTGNLYQTTEGAWRLRLPRKAFKNFRGAAKHRDYDMPVDQSAWSDIERYLREYRSMLKHADTCSYVFLSSNGGHSGAWDGLNRRVGELTRRYLLRCPGAGPHVFRHIVATSILKSSPNDWQTAALVLHDKVETVEKHYAHLRTSDGGTRMLHLLESAFQRM